MESAEVHCPSFMHFFTHRVTACQKKGRSTEDNSKTTAEGNRQQQRKTAEHQQRQTERTKEGSEEHNSKNNRRGKTNNSSARQLNKATATEGSGGGRDPLVPCTAGIEKERFVALKKRKVRIAPFNLAPPGSPRARLWGG